MLMKDRIKLVKGDITTVKADAIVNAANKSLRGGGGVDGAIHHAAGPELLCECLTLNGCNTGEAKITNGYDLAVRNIIHTVGPIWRGGHRDEHSLLASSYRNALLLAYQHGLETLAFPNISTGVYGFPPGQAAKIAITEVKRFLSNHDNPKEVIFVLFTEENYNLYNKLIKNEGIDQ